MRIIFLVGLPGSGKTYLGEKMEEEDSNITYIDDITVRGGLDDIETAINVWGAENIVVSDVFLCRKYDRKMAIKKLAKIAPNYKLEWIFFENNPGKCIRNVRYRNQKGDTRKVEGLIADLTKRYVIPEDVIPRRIWNEDA